MLIARPCCTGTESSRGLYVSLALSSRRDCFLGVGMELAAGQNLALSDMHLLIEVQSAPGVEHQVALLGVGEDDHATLPSWCLTAGRTSAPGGCLQMPTTSRAGVRTISATVTLAAVPVDVLRILIAAGSADDASFSVTVRDVATRSILASFASGRRVHESTVVTLEVYRRGDTWKVRALGEVITGGLPELLLTRGFATLQSAGDPPQGAPRSAFSSAHPPVAPSGSSQTIDWLSPPAPAGYE